MRFATKLQSVQRKKKFLLVRSFKLQPGGKQGLLKRRLKDMLRPLQGYFAILRPFQEFKCLYKIKVSVFKPV